MKMKMKKIIYTLLSVLVLMSCVSNNNIKTTNSDISDSGPKKKAADVKAPVKITSAISNDKPTDYIFTGCTRSGLSTSPDRIKRLNMLKNRSIPANLIPKVILISDILKPGVDSLRYDPSQFVSITGYIILVKYGGAESCNCKTSDKSKWDIHIELAANPDDVGSKSMICEAGITSRLSNGELTMDKIKPMNGKKVTITGYLFPDSEHWAESANTNPTGTTIWRNTEWEIHPISSITLDK